MTQGLRIKIAEWLDPGAARGDELRATWARLEIYVDDHIATKVVDSFTARSVRDAIYVPAYPLAEWIATHWWFLLFERHEARPGFDRRHCLRYAGDGFAFPSVTILSDGIKSSIEIEPRASPNAGVQFLEGFCATVDQTQVFEEFRSFISAVCLRLEEQNVHGTLLQEDWKAISSARQDEIDFCQCVASMGRDPYALEADEVSAVLAVREQVQSDLLWNDLTESISLQTLVSCANWLQNAASEVRHTVKFEPSVSRHDLNGALHPHNSAGWQQGYEGARSLWATGKLKVEGGAGRLDWGSVFKNWEGPSWLNKHRVTTAPEKTIHALIEAAEDRFGIAVSSSKGLRKESQAFLMARALSEFLWHESSAIGHSLLTASQAWRQQRSRAFAAELLAPSSDIENQLSGSRISNDEVDDLADHYGVSDWVIRHQLKNHELAIVRD